MITIGKKKSDELGMLSSTLCMIHCMVTPFLLAVLPATFHGGHQWWSWIDIVFLGISCIAVIYTVQQSALRWLKTGLMVSLGLLTFFVFNERFEGIEFPFDMVYFPAFALVVLHLINRRQCRCQAGCCKKT